MLRAAEIALMTSILVASVLWAAALRTRGVERLMRRRPLCALCLIDSSLDVLIEADEFVRSGAGRLIPVCEKCRQRKFLCTDMGHMSLDEGMDEFLVQEIMDL